MNRTTPLIGLLTGLLVLSASATAQVADASDNRWATQLHKEFGFDEMAEEIFGRMVNEPGRSATEKQQGKLGLASLKASQGRRASTLDERLRLMDDARKLMDEVVRNWPDRTSPEYYQAIFAMVEVLEQRGTIAMEAVTGGELTDAEAGKYREVANGDFGRAEVELDKIRAAMGEVDPVKNREKWRLRNRSWYLLCLLKLNRGLIQDPKSFERQKYLMGASEQLEEFILENETDDSEAMLGALYGYLLKGRVHDELGEKGEATANFTSVLDQLLWEEKLHPSVQGLAEQAYYFLLKHLNAGRDYANTVRYGVEMLERWEDLKMPFRSYGRATKVELAQAHFRRGETNQALALAAQVVQSGAKDGSVVLANRQIAEIIAATPDKSQFSADIIRSAANGAWSQGRDSWGEACRYFTILLQVVDAMEDKEQGSYFGAEAYWKMGYRFYDAERYLEAAVLFEEGVKKYKDVSRDELNANLAKYWERCLQLELARTKSDAVKQLKKECTAWLIRFPIGAKQPGDLLYDQARGEESKAREFARQKGKTDEAIAAYGLAAATYKKAVESGGRKKERAMVKGAVTGFRAGKLLAKARRVQEALPRLTEAKQQFQAYLKFAANPANKLTDPRYIAARATAQAEAKWSIAEVNLLLGANGGNTKALHEENVKLLADFETKHKAQRNLVLFALDIRQRSNLALGNIPAAQTDYRVMKSIDPEDRMTGSAGLRVARKVRKPVEDKFKAIVGPKTMADDKRKWAEVSQKPGFEAARTATIEAYDLYREWLLSSKIGAADFNNWYTISFYYYRVGAWKKAADLLQQGVERFENLSSADAKKLGKMRYRLMVCSYFMAKEAEAARQADKAGQLWNQAGRMADAIVADKKNPHDRYLVGKRFLAEIYGGYVVKNGLQVKWIPALGQYDKANKLWKTLRQREENGTPEWWAATFNLYYTVLQDRKARNQRVSDLQKAFASLKATNPTLGGSEWKPLFDWLERQIR